jgi:hypothetical protein
MGDLTIAGLSEKDSNNLRTRWRLAPREVYDAEYVKEFVEKTVGEFMRDPRPTHAPRAYRSRSKPTRSATRNASR